MFDLPQNNKRRRAAVPAWYALILLLITVGLAAVVTNARRALPLGDEVAPRDWRITFRPPRYWRSQDDIQGVAAFREPQTSRGQTRVLVVEELPNPDNADPIDIARDWRFQWGSDTLQQMHLRRIQATVRAEPFGPLEGAWLEDHEKGIVAHVGLFDRRAVCVGVIFGDIPVSRRDRMIVRTVVDSVRFRD